MAIKKNFYLLLYSFISILKLDLYIFSVFDRDDIAQQLSLIIMNYQLSIIVIRLKSTTVSLLMMCFILQGKVIKFICL